MTITINGNKGEFLYNIVTDGEKCSIVEQDAERIATRYGRITINGDNVSPSKEDISHACITNGKVKLKAEDIARPVNEYYKRMGKSPFCF